MKIKQNLINIFCTHIYWKFELSLRGKRYRWKAELLRLWINTLFFVIKLLFCAIAWDSIRIEIIKQSWWWVTIKRKKKVTGNMTMQMIELYYITSIKEWWDCRYSFWVRFLEKESHRMNTTIVNNEHRSEMSVECIDDLLRCNKHCIYATQNPPLWLIEHKEKSPWNSINSIPVGHDVLKLIIMMSDSDNSFILHK